MYLFQVDVIIFLGTAMALFLYFFLFCFNENELYDASDLVIFTLTLFQLFDCELMMADIVVSHFNSSALNSYLLNK